jgi:hypothetical protein
MMAMPASIAASATASFRSPFWVSVWLLIARLLSGVLCVDALSDFQ